MCVADRMHKAIPNIHAFKRLLWIYTYACAHRIVSFYLYNPLSVGISISSSNLVTSNVFFLSSNPFFSMKTSKMEMIMLVICIHSNRDVYTLAENKMGERKAALVILLQASMKLDGFWLKKEEEYTFKIPSMTKRQNNQ